MLKTSMVRSVGAIFLTLGSVSAAVAQQQPLTQRSQETSETPSGNPLRLFDINPAFAPAGAAYPTRATIHGAGFTPTGNLVEFGPVKISDVPATESSRITFSIPKIIPTKGEVPPIVLPPGAYRVTVMTAGRKSNALSFTLTRGP
jgi:hypothetical protein